MRIHKFWPLVLIGHLLIPAAEAAGERPAEPPIPDRLTRKQAVDLALARNPAIHAARRQLEAARGRRLRADGFDAPTFFWELEEANSLDPAEAGTQRYGVEQNFDWIGKRQADKRVADLGVEAAEAWLQRTRLRVEARTRKAFDRVLLAEAVLALLEQVRGFTEESVAISRARFKSGTGTYTDLLRTRVARERLDNDLRTARTAALESRRGLSVLLAGGLAHTALAGKLEAPSLRPDRERWLAELKAGSPTFALIDRRFRQAEQRYQSVRQQRFPELTVGLARQRGYDGISAEYSWAGLLNLTLPLPGTDRQNGLEAEARAESWALRDRGRRLRLQAGARLDQRYDEARSLAGQLRNFEQAILPDVEDQRRAAQQEYRVRRIDALNLLDVYNTYLDTRRDYLETVTRYRAALADLDALGEDLWEIEL